MLSANSPSLIAWYRNTGSGIFEAQATVSNSAVGATWVTTGNLSGTGEIDIISASFFDDKIAWYPNTAGSFGAQQVLTTNADSAACAYAADLTGSGTIDVISASASDDRILWFENFGGGSFSSERNVSTLVDEALSVYAADLNQDGLVVSDNFGDVSYGFKHFLFPLGLPNLPPTFNLKFWES